MEQILEHSEASSPDNSIPSSFLFIGELARETGSDPKTIRFYERADLLSPPRHGRFRTYLASDVKRLKNVLLLRKMGVPIAKIRELFATAGAESDILSDPRALDLLRDHLAALKSRQDEIHQQMAQTSRAIESLAT